MRPILLLVAVVPLSSGCFPYAYPSLCVHPPVEVNASPGEPATAFRVNVSAWRSRFIGSREDPEFTFTDLNDDLDATTPRAASVHASGGWGLPPLIVGGKHRYSCTKLYRRGYRTLVLEAWTDVTRAEWKPTCGAEERFQAVRDLLYATPKRSAPLRIDSREWEDSDVRVGQLHETMGWEKREDETPYFWSTATLRRGSWSDTHRKGLEFAHDELSTLLKEPDVDEPLRKRIEYLMSRLDEVIER